MSTTTLARRLGLGTLLFYGIGDILGAGIYVLVGKVAGIAGQSAWLSFLVAAALALITGLSYAELASRIPKSAGAAAFCARAFQRYPLIPFLVGCLILASGITSSATVALAVHGYLEVFLTASPIVTAIGLIVLISLINFWGIQESANANLLMTLMEVSGLLLVIFVGLGVARNLSGAEMATRVTPDADWSAVMTGATLAFYAFIGFEDIVNLSEETKNPERNVPRAILGAVAVTSVIYLIVVFVVLWTMTPVQAAASGRPLLEVLRLGAFPLPPWAFALVALFSVSNTGLANLVMASRLLYGMADGGLLPRSLTRIHPTRRTPHLAVLAAMALCILMVVTGTVQIMAQTTSLLLVSAFAFVHVSLMIVRRREPGSALVFRVPRAVPYLGVGLCLFLICRFPGAAYFRMAVVLATGSIVYFLFQRSKEKV